MLVDVSTEFDIVVLGDCGILGDLLARLLVYLEFSSLPQKSSQAPGIDSQDVHQRRHRRLAQPRGVLLVPPLYLNSICFVSILSC